VKCLVILSRETNERQGDDGSDWGKLKKGKAAGKRPVDASQQYQLKHFELTGQVEACEYDEAQSVNLLGLAPGQLGARRRSRAELGAGEGSEVDDGRGLGANMLTATGKDQQASRLGTVTFVKPLIDITVTEGKTAAFECFISNADASVTWLLNDTPVPAERAQILSVGKTRRLVLQDCALNENNLRVTCVLDEATKSTGQLFVKEQPFEFVDTLKNVKVKLNSPCELQCTVNKLNVALQWFKDGQSTVDIKEDVDGYIHKLNLSNVQEKDKGTYMAKYDTIQTECQVDVLSMYL
jgi:hypothetical protein